MIMPDQDATDNVLSEKARGKQRAVASPLDAPPSVGSSLSMRNLNQRTLLLRFTEGIPDLEVEVKTTDTVGDVKKTVRSARPDLSDRRLRLIHSGQLLSDKTMLFSWLEALEKRKHRPENPETFNEVTWIHCSVGPKLEPSEVESDETQTAQIKPVRGFDRLATAGFSEADIANIRRQFHTHSSANFLDDREFETDEDYEEHARAMEEQWIDSMDTVGSASLSQGSSSNTALMQGTFIGFFFPILPLFFLRKPSTSAFWDDNTEVEAPESVIFSRSTQMGIVVGFIMNICLGMWMFLLDST